LWLEIIDKSIIPVGDDGCGGVCKVDNEQKTWGRIEKPSVEISYN
jgi:hypothetical protein